MNGLRINVVIALVAITGIAIYGGLALAAEGQYEYAAAIFGAAITAMAAVMKALTDPDVPVVPSSVVMKMLDASMPEDTSQRFQVRPNAVLCLLMIGILSLGGGWAVVSHGNVELGYAVFALGIGAAAATLSDLIRPADKDVPLPLANKIADVMGVKHVE